jgi:NTE family protein
MHQLVARLAPAFGRGIYVGAWLEAASVSERWQDLAARGVIVSGMVLLGADTALGPIHLAYRIGEGGHRRFYLAFGRSMANSGVGSAW